MATYRVARRIGQTEEDPMTQPTSQPTTEWPPPAERDPEPHPDAGTAAWLAWRHREMLRIPRRELI